MKWGSNVKKDQQSEAPVEAVHITCHGIRNSMETILDRHPAQSTDQCLAGWQFRASYGVSSLSYGPIKIKR